MRACYIVRMYLCYYLSRREIYGHRYSIYRDILNSDRPVFNSDHPRICAYGGEACLLGPLKSLRVLHCTESRLWLRALYSSRETISAEPTCVL